MAKKERCLRINYKTGIPEKVMEYVATGKTINVVETNYIGYSNIAFVAKNDICLISDQNFIEVIDRSISDSPFKITRDLFDLTAETISNLGIKNYEQLSILKDVITEANATHPAIMKDMKHGDFHLYKQCQEDLIRAKVVAKNTQAPTSPKTT